MTFCCNFLFIDEVQPQGCCRTEDVLTYWCDVTFCSPFHDHIACVHIQVPKYHIAVILKCWLIHWNTPPASWSSKRQKKRCCQDLHKNHFVLPRQDRTVTIPYNPYKSAEWLISWRHLKCLTCGTVNQGKQRTPLLNVYVPILSHGAQSS